MSTTGNGTRNELEEEVVLSPRARAASSHRQPFDRPVRGLLAVLVLVAATAAASASASAAPLDDAGATARTTPAVPTAVEPPPAPAATPGPPSSVPASLAAENAPALNPDAPGIRASAPTSTLGAPTSLGQVALRSIAYPWRQALPGWTVGFEGGEGARRGTTDPAGRSITIAIAADDDPASVARVIAHELGHAVDLTYNDTSSRRAWEAQRGLGESVPWWPAPGTGDFSTGSGDFAECFASWQLDVRSRSTFGSCTRAEKAMVASLAGPA